MQRIFFLFLDLGQRGNTFECELKQLMQQSRRAERTYSYVCANTDTRAAIIMHCSHQPLGSDGLVDINS